MSNNQTLGSDTTVLKKHQIKSIPNVLPDWLTISSSDVPMPSPSKEKKDLIAAKYETVFPLFLEKVACGISLKDALKEDFRKFEYGEFVKWVLKNPTRKSEYYEALSVGSEFVASQLLQIADGEDSLEEVSRSTLRINTRKYLLQIWNKSRFGEVKQIEHTGSINIIQALEDAKKRVIDMEPVDADWEEVGNN